MYKDILLAVDLGEEGSWRKAMATAVEYARAFGSRLHVMTVLPDFGMSVVSQYFPQDHMDRMVAEADQRLHALVSAKVPGDVTVQHIVKQGTVYESIVSTAGEIGADLIVIGSHRPELRDYFIGPNADRVVRHAACSVLVVRE